MKHLMNIIPVIVILVLTTNISSLYAIDFTNDYMLYVYGSRSCPHCHTLANYLIDKEMAFTWFWIEDKDNLDVLKNMVEDLEISQGTPTTVVYVNGKPVAIVLGAITEDSFWKNIIDNPSNSLRIFYGDKLIKEIPVPSNFTQKYIAKNPASYDDVKTYAKGSAETNPFEYLPTIILIALLIGAVILIYIRKV